MIPPEEEQQEVLVQQHSLRRAILPSTSESTSASNSRVTVNLPSRSTANTATMSSTPGGGHRRNLSLSQANSRAIPVAVAAGRLSGLATPPVSASGANRLPLIGRRTSHNASTTAQSSSSSASKDKMDLDPEGKTGRKRDGGRGEGDEEDEEVVWGNGGRGEGFAIPKYLKRGIWGDENELGIKLVTGRRSLAVGTVKETLGSSTSGSKRRVPEDVGDDRKRVVRLPTHWSWDDRCTLAELTSDGLGVAFAGSAKYGDRDAAAVRSNYPIPVSSPSSSSSHPTPTLPLYYYEITILDRGESGYISIGLSHSNVSLARLPGWENNSWGYHGDDGRKFCCLGTGERFSETFGTGDTVGCGVDYMEVPGEKRGNDEDREGGKKKKKGARCFFTKNGEFLGYAFDNLHGTLYPSVGLRTPGENVKANFGATPFRFDIEAFVRDRQHSLLNTIASFPPPPSLLLSPDPSDLSTSSDAKRETSESRVNALKLIESYLLHHGYGGTAAALTKQLREESKEKQVGFTSTTASPSSEEQMDIDLEHEETRGRGESRRLQIRSAYLSGDISLVLKLVTEYYPKVLEEEYFSISDTGEESGEMMGNGNGGMLFRLKLREFVEAVIKVREEEEMADAFRSGVGKGKGRAVDDPTASTATSSLDELLSLGRELSSTYSSHPSKQVQEDLKWTFSLMAYLKPEEKEGRTGWLLESERRSEGADELNRAILVSQSLPPIPHLESIYRHAAASVRLAAECGSGNAALVDVREVVFGGTRVE